MNNVKYIEEFNSRKNRTMTLGLNHFADMVKTKYLSTRVILNTSIGFRRHKLQLVLISGIQPAPNLIVTDNKYLKPLFFK